MDTNGNGMLDPEEAQGPARFMLDRMARSNPKIDVTKPIPMSILTESFQQMRSGSSSGNFGGSSDEETPILEKDALVSGFGTIMIPKAPIPGFGAKGEKFSTPVDERDLKEADERIGRYDRNNDQQLDENELKEGRWSDSPMQYDKNRDGKISRQELAVRQARRRLASGSSDSSASQRKEEGNNKRAKEGRDRDRDNAEDKKAQANPFEKIPSYKVAPSQAGLPEWFTRNDVNMDNQVSMAEFSKKWSAETIDDFLRFDPNGDGFITNKECLLAVKKGFIPGTGGGSAASTPAASSSSATGSSASGSSGSGSSGSVAAKPAEATRSAGGTEDANVKAMKNWAAPKIKKEDKNADGFLTPDEYSGSSGPFADVDTNKDGRIDLDEYVAARMKKRS